MCMKYYFQVHYHIQLNKRDVIMGVVKIAEILYGGFYYNFRDYHIMLPFAHISCLNQNFRI